MGQPRVLFLMLQIFSQSWKVTFQCLPDVFPSSWPLSRPMRMFLSSVRCCMSTRGYAPPPSQLRGQLRRSKSLCETLVSIRADEHIDWGSFMQQQQLESSPRWSRQLRSRLCTSELQLSSYGQSELQFLSSQPHAFVSQSSTKLLSRKPRQHFDFSK